jgi:hypothetical protein
LYEVGIVVDREGQWSKATTVAPLSSAHAAERQGSLRRFPGDQRMLAFEP